MQGLHFLREEFYILQRFKHALPNLRVKAARSSLFMWSTLLFKVFQTHYSNRWVNFCTYNMQGLRVIKYALMEFDFKKNHPCVFAICIDQRTWLNYVRSKNRVVYERAHMSELR